MSRAIKSTYLQWAPFALANGFVRVMKRKPYNLKIIVHVQVFYILQIINGFFFRYEKGNKLYDFLSNFWLQLFIIIINLRDVSY